MKNNRRLLLRVCAGITLLLATQYHSVFAQNTEPTESMYTSLNLVTSMAPTTFKKYYKLGPGFGLGIISKLDDRLSLRTEFRYNRYGFKRYKYLSDRAYEVNVPHNVSAKTFSISADLIYDLLGDPGSVQLYTVLGPGFMNFDGGLYTDATGTQTYSARSFGLTFGTGLKIPVGSYVKIYLETDYQTQFEKHGSRELWPISFGISFSPKQ